MPTRAFRDGRFCAPKARYRAASHETAGKQFSPLIGLSVITHFEDGTMPIAEINGATINYQWDQGQGASRATDPIVMLSNSLSSNLSMWDKQVPVLLEHGFKVLRYDSRGHGQSSVPEEPYSIAMLAADAIALIRQFRRRACAFLWPIDGRYGRAISCKSPRRQARVRDIMRDCSPS